MIPERLKSPPSRRIPDASRRRVTLIPELTGEQRSVSCETRETPATRSRGNVDSLVQREVTSAASRAQLRAPLVGSGLPRSAASPNSLGSSSYSRFSRKRTRPRLDKARSAISHLTRSPFRDDSDDDARSVRRTRIVKARTVRSDEVSRSTVRLTARLPFFTLGLASRSADEPTRPYEA